MESLQKVNSGRGQRNGNEWGEPRCRISAEDPAREIEHCARERVDPFRSCHESNVARVECWRTVSAESALDR